MGFFSPWFLVGALGVGLPLWLHLLRRHKTEPREFSSLMFFEQRQQSSVKHRRLRYLLLLALRIALLVLLALLFARPYFITQNAQVTGNKLRIIAVDRSFSMRTTSALDRAKTEAHSLVSSRGAGTQAQVVALNGSVEVLTQPTNDPAGLDAAIDGIMPGDGKTAYGELARFARTVAANSKVPIELHLIGDLQKSGLPPGFADLQLPNGTDLQVHSVAPSNTKNFAVENVRAPGVVTDPKKVRFEVTVAAYQTAEPAKKTVSILMNGQTVQTKEVTIPAFGRGRVEFTGLDASFGLNKGEVRIDGGDALPADDKFYFGFDRVEPRKVLVAHDSRQARSLTYLRAALESAGDTPFTIDAMSCETTAGVDPTKYAFVMLSDCGTLPNTFEADLRKYAQAGGAVFVTLGFSSASRTKVPLTDWTIETSRYEGRDGERFLVASQVDAGHPVTRRADAFDAVRFYQIVRFTPGPSRTIAKVGDGGALLSELAFGEGKVMVFGSTLDNLANDFPLHASFVPFVEHMFNYMGGTSEKPGSVPVS
ncbi:MAG: BatA and WFA domain-containing protein, partial [Acidobacteria bacterium]|nr:BatA and WFA domain-containing protein [Acidobacteriota bacterium]